MSKSSSSSSSGIGFAGLLAILFIALKLLGKIDWSWWWVLSPLWIGLAIALLIGAVGLLAVGVATLLDKIQAARRRARRARQ